MLIVSACLAGMRTRFDGEARAHAKVMELVRSGRAIPLCPEQLGGLPTPRPPVDFDEVGGGDALLDGAARVLTAAGEDRSAALHRGATEMLRAARLFGAEGVVLKDGSPSCGVSYVYVRGVRSPGRGVAAALLAREGLRVIPVDSL